jgi:hypothetical protein
MSLFKNWKARKAIKRHKEKKAAVAFWRQRSREGRVKGMAHYRITGKGWRG